MHMPVLLKEVIEALDVQPGGRYIDCTVGGGGHAISILEQSSPGGQLLGIDADPKAIETAEARLQAYANSSLLINENFTNLQATCIKYDFFPVHGILFDLGLSSLQLNNDERGFSFQHDAPLDMRLSPSQEVTAADIVNKLSETELAHLIKTYGEERYSYKIAPYIVQQRPITTTLHLAHILEQAFKGRRGRIHPATRTFQALRIAVNQELENLESALRQAINLLGINGRLVVISYHSLEDRIVKRFLQREAKDCICPPSTLTCICGHQASLRLISKKVITPSLAEIKTNPRSRSAKLRVAEHVTSQDEQLFYHDIAESLFFPSGIEAKGWRRPALVEKLRRTFIALQIDNS
jgi:16S rRNA (cytosine1402-N4)-methyltransferase